MICEGSNNWTRGGEKKTEISKNKLNFEYETTFIEVRRERERRQEKI